MLRFSKTYTFAKPTLHVNEEGTRTTQFDPETAVPFQATVYPATGKRVLEVYGVRTQRMLNALTVDSNVAEGDAVFIGAEAYKVINRADYSRHSELDLELM